MRIVSLLPSATEIVCALGLTDSLVGVTHECDYPSGVSRLPHVTCTAIPPTANSREIDSRVRERIQTRSALYSLDMERLTRLQPDLIVTQALCDVCAVAEAEVREAACSLGARGGKTPQVVNLEPMSLSDVFETIRLLGDAVGIPGRAETVVRDLQERVERVQARSRGLDSRPRVVLLEWIDPPFSCGHWSPSLVEMAGGIEGLGRAGVASRTLRWEEIMAWQPEILFIACCGFSVERTRQDLPLLWEQPGWSDLPCAQSGRVYVADGSAYFSRPGPRLVDGLEMLAHALHPTVHPLPPHVPAALRV